MKLSSEYNKQMFWARNHWVSKNPDLLVTELNDFVAKDWETVLHAINDDQKPVALVSSCLKKGQEHYELKGIVLPKGFLSQYDQHIPDFSDRVSDVEEERFLQNPALHLQTIRDNNFLRINLSDGKSHFHIAGQWMVAHIKINKESKAQLLPHPENPTDINKLSL